jgi:hypothetical protein
MSSNSPHGSECVAPWPTALVDHAGDSRPYKIADLLGPEHPEHVGLRDARLVRDRLDRRTVKSTIRELTRGDPSAWDRRSDPLIRTATNIRLQLSNY